MLRLQTMRAILDPDDISASGVESSGRTQIRPGGDVVGFGMYSGCSVEDLCAFNAPDNGYINVFPLLSVESVSIQLYSRFQLPYHVQSRFVGQVQTEFM